MDSRLIGRVVVGLALGTIAAVAIVLLVAGFQKNAQINSLRTHGVPVEATVTGCVGLIGGSGSNPAGYNCTASYTVGGHHYSEGLPGDALVPPGSTVHGVTVPGDPALFSTPQAVAAERASWRVLYAPAILLAVLLLLVGVLVIRRHVANKA